MMKAMLACAIVLMLPYCGLAVERPVPEPFFPGLFTALTDKSGCSVAIVRFVADSDGGSQLEPKPNFVRIKLIPLAAITGQPPESIVEFAKDDKARLRGSEGGWNAIPLPAEGAVAVVARTPSGVVWTSPVRISGWDTIYGMGLLRPGDDLRVEGIKERTQDILKSDISSLLPGAFDSGANAWDTFLICDRLVSDPTGWKSLSLDHWKQVTTWATAEQRSIRFRSYFWTSLSRNITQLDLAVIKELIPVALAGFADANEHGLPRMCASGFIRKALPIAGNSLEEEVITNLIKVYSSEALQNSLHTRNEFANCDGTYCLGYNDQKAMGQMMKGVLDDVGRVLQGKK